MKERFEVLDIFRGIFASLVVFFHLSAFADTPLFKNEFVLNSDLFVDFFFVLSGFVIGYNYQSLSTKRQLSRFFQKRFIRIYPLHIAVLLAFVLIELLKHSASAYVHVNKLENPNNSIITFFSNAFLINSIKLPGVSDVSWNIASWSISAEMIAYLVFGLTMFSVSSRRRPTFKSIACLAVLLAASGTLYLATGKLKLLYNFDYGFLRGIIGFFSGVICLYVYNATNTSLKSRNKAWFNVAEIGCLATIVWVVCHGNQYKDNGFMYESLFFISILIFALEKGILSALLKRSALLSRVGRYSYSIYMTHTLILSLFNIVFIRILKFPPSAYAYLFIVNYLLIYYVSAWTFKNIETRFNRLGRKLLDRSKKVNMLDDEEQQEQVVTVPVP